MKKTYRKIRWWLRDLIIGNHMRKNIKNSKFSIISSDCTGGLLYHDLHEKFNSPTINMYMDAKDFLKFCSDLERYLKGNLEEKKNTDFDFPVGIIDDIEIKFVHYKSFDEAKNKWNERKQRVNNENIFIIMNDRNNCCEDEIKEFDKLNYKNKVIFTHKQYPQYNSTFYIEKYKNSNEVGIMTAFKNPISIKREYDEFDWVGFFNEK